ncbi:MAG: agmatinase [Actinomycetota bacterium]|nr:agmatinase [Actinomycetota bacterium]
MTAPGRFLEARAKRNEAQAAVLGLPFDGSVSWRNGAAGAPPEIRLASQSIESYSPVTGRDLEDLVLADLGDVALSGATPREAMDIIANEVERIAGEGVFLVSLGGDHSVSIGTTAGMRRIHQDLTHVVFDAHFDLRESYDGSDLSHACGTRHMAANGMTSVLGVRSGSREEYQDAPKLLAYHDEAVALPPDVRKLYDGKPVFLSVDLDVLDPATFPGTGNPEPGGPSYKELRSALLSLEGLNVVGIDLVEAAPGLDASGLTAVVAAELCRELLLTFTR